MKTQERWRDVRGHAGIQVSDLGRVRSRRKVGGGTSALTDGWHPLKPAAYGKGKTLAVHLTPKKIGYVGRLVWEAFVGPVPKGLKVLHKVRDKANNALGNLRLGTADGHGDLLRGRPNPHAAKMTAAEVIAARADAAAGMLGPDLEKKYKRPRVTLYAVIRGRSWRHLPGIIPELRKYRTESRAKSLAGTV